MGKCLLVKQICMKPFSSHFPVSEPLLAYRYKLHLVNLTWLEMKKFCGGSGAWNSICKACSKAQKSVVLSSWFELMVCKLVRQMIQWDV